MITLICFVQWIVSMASAGNITHQNKVLFKRFHQTLGSEIFQKILKTRRCASCKSIYHSLTDNLKSRDASASKNEQLKNTKNHGQSEFVRMKREEALQAQTEIIDTISTSSIAHGGHLRL